MTASYSASDLEEHLIDIDDSQLAELEDLDYVVVPLGVGEPPSQEKLAKAKTRRLFRSLLAAAIFSLACVMYISADIWELAEETKRPTTSLDIQYIRRSDVVLSVEFSGINGDYEIVECDTVVSREWQLNDPQGPCACLNSNLTSFSVSFYASIEGTKYVLSGSLVAPKGAEIWLSSLKFVDIHGDGKPGQHASIEATSSLSGGQAWTQGICLSLADTNGAKEFAITTFAQRETIPALKVIAVFAVALIYFREVFEFLHKAKRSVKTYQSQLRLARWMSAQDMQNKAL